MNPILTRMLKKPRRLLGRDGVTLSLVSSVVDTVNAVRNMQIRYGPRFAVHLSQTNAVVEIPRPEARALQAGTPDHPWKPYNPPWTGEGERPADWGLRVRLIPGTVAGRLPANWNAVLELEAEAEGRWVYLEVSVDQNGTVTEAEIKEAASPPVASQPTEPGAIPAILYQPLFCYDSSALAVQRVYVATKTNLAVRVETSRPGCEDFLRLAGLVAA